MNLGGTQTDIVSVGALVHLSIGSEWRLCHCEVITCHPQALTKIQVKQAPTHICCLFPEVCQFFVQKDSPFFIKSVYFYITEVEKIFIQESVLMLFDLK